MDKMTNIPTPNRLISLLTDYGFKITFANKKNRLFLRKALQLLIKSQIPVKKVKHLPTEIEGYTESARKGFYDTACLADSDLYFIVEMQVGNYTYLIERLLFYLSHLYITQVKKGTEGFENIKKVHCICITKDTIFKEVEEYYHKANFRTETGMKITDSMEIIFVELEKFTKLADEIDNEFEELIFTMKNAHTIDITDPIQVPAFWRKEWLQGAIKELNERTMSPENRALYHISLGRLMAINEHYEMERKELRVEITEEVTHKVTEEVTHKVTEEVTHKVTEEVTHKVTEEVTHKVTEELTRNMQFDNIQKLLKLNKMTIEEIADFNNVSIDFVFEIKDNMSKTVK
jgi:predicted transposase/invertase (TIGR01784 family)